MNGCVYGFRVKEASCVLFAFACVSILLWTRERPPFLTSVLSTQLWDFSPAKEESIPKVNTEEGRRSPATGGNTKEVPSIFYTNPPSSDDLTLWISNRDNRSVISHNKKGCNYFQGKWVVDDTRPFYSGSECTRWLSGMWACRLNRRPDFSYEKLRWKPKDCEMEDFTATKFLARMQDKTVAFIGDSLARQQFQSLMCMATGGKDRPDVQDVGKEYGLVKARHAKRPDGWAYRFPSTNTTILYYWSASLSNLEPLNSSARTDYAMHLDRPPAFVSKFLHKFDILVLNTGHHWNLDKLKANRWIMYINGKPNTDQKIAEDMQAAKNLTIHSIVHWVNSQLPKHPTLKAFYRTISPRHFINGDWNTGGTCDNIIPSSTGKEVSQDESKDPFPFSAMKGTNVTLLDITSISQVRDDAHISKYSIRPSPGMQDCLHWCLPGVPDTWNELLFEHI
ncbi:unnamed protein product [Rhodiola kirilowii]